MSHVPMHSALYETCTLRCLLCYDLLLKLFIVLMTRTLNLYCAYDHTFRFSVLWAALKTFDVLCDWCLCMTCFYIWFLLMTFDHVLLDIFPCILSCPKCTCTLLHVSVLVLLPCFVLLPCNMTCLCWIPWPCLCPLCTSTFNTCTCCAHYCWCIAMTLIGYLISSWVSLMEVLLHCFPASYSLVFYVFLYVFWAPCHVIPMCLTYGK